MYASNQKRLSDNKDATCATETICVFVRQKRPNSFSICMLPSQTRSFSNTGGSCLMLLLGPGKIRISQKSH